MLEYAILIAVKNYNNYITDFLRGESSERNLAISHQSG
jgi:hypothetical protein